MTQRALVFTLVLGAAPLSGCPFAGRCGSERFELDGELSVGELLELGLVPGEEPSDAACEQACDLVLGEADEGNLRKLKECKLIVDDKAFVEGAASAVIAGQVRCRGRLVPECK